MRRFLQPTVFAGLALGLAAFAALRHLDAPLLPLAAAGHFVILLASAQVPSRLHWKEELARISAFNRKLLWVYGGFTVLTIAAFGVLLIALRPELESGDRAARMIAAFISVYWTARIGVDLFVFRHEDWPKGPAFTIGHTCLTGTFAFIAMTCGFIAGGRV